MKKLIYWLIVDSDGKVVEKETTRKSARLVKGFLEEHVFDEFFEDIAYPIHIEREEWQLAGRKVVR